MTDFDQQTDSPKQDDSKQSQANPRVVVGVLVVVGVAALILGWFNVLNVIRSPFAPTNTPTDKELASESVARDDQLKQQDTDGDSLSDFDELYAYGTSPFLNDSDSDGRDDKTELAGETDPNCPEGQSCGFLPPTDSNANTNVSVAGNTNGSGNQNINASTSDLISSDPVVATLRQTLKDAGAPAYVVDKLDDAALLDLYRSTVSEQPGSANAAANTNLSQTDVIQSLRGASPAEIRELLTSGGADEGLLQEVDDAALQTIFDQALSEELNSQTQSPPKP